MKIVLMVSWWIIAILLIMNFFQWQQNRALVSLRQTENQICNNIINALKPVPQSTPSPGSK
jgi:regulatory protein YycI of two-component signal transduction system YycFG